MIEKLANLGINLNNRTNGELKTKCPKCSHNRKNKHDESTFFDALHVWSWLDPFYGKSFKKE